MTERDHLDPLDSHPNAVSRVDRADGPAAAPISPQTGVLRRRERIVGWKHKIAGGGVSSDKGVVTLQWQPPVFRATQHDQRGPLSRSGRGRALPCARCSMGWKR